MVKEQGKWKPFFVKAIETGYLDTRYEKDTDYDSVFADMRRWEPTQPMSCCIGKI